MEKMTKEFLKEVADYIFKKDSNYIEGSPIKGIRGCITRGFLDIGDFSHCGDDRCIECNFMQKVQKDELLRINFKPYSNEG